jgi:hypothetical protein
MNEHVETLEPKIRAVRAHGALVAVADKVGSES